MRIFTLFCLCTLLFCCKSREFPADTTSQNMLRFGSGGGVTGFYTHYTLLDDGRLYKQADPDKAVVWLKKIPGKTHKDCFARVDSLGLKTLDFKEPGNMTYYIDLVEAGAHHEISWGERKALVPPGVQQLYDDLIALTRAE